MQVIVVASEEETGGFLAPSITILARTGWKGNASLEKCPIRLSKLNSLQKLGKKSYRKSPEVGQNQVKGSKIDQIKNQTANLNKHVGIHQFQPTTTVGINQFKPSEFPILK